MPDTDEQTVEEGLEPRAVKRDRHGRILPGSAAINPFPKGQSGNPGGRPHGPVSILKDYLEGNRGLPPEWLEGDEAWIPPEVQAVLKQEGVGAALVLSMLAMGLNPHVDPKDRIKAIEWVANRYDGPLVKQLDVRSASIQRREVVIVGVMPGDEEGDPPFPPEVTDVEALEEKAREEANKRRQEALGMAEAEEPPKSSGRRRKRRGNGQGEGRSNGSNTDG